MKFFIYSLIILFSTTLMAQTRSFNELVHDNHINLKSKSLKSWLRVFNSPQKIKEYGFLMSETERFIMLKTLKKRQKQSVKKYARRLR